MNLLQEIIISLLSGLTTKTGNEIHWKDEYGNDVTIEIIDISQEKYIVRYYYDNGQKFWEIEYSNGQLHGKYIEWYESGQKHYEIEYQNGRQHGKDIAWHKNGQKWLEAEYRNGKKHGKATDWLENGQKLREIKYMNGERIE